MDKPMESPLKALLNNSRPSPGPSNVSKVDEILTKISLVYQILKYLNHLYYRFNNPDCLLNRRWFIRILCQQDHKMP